MDSSHLYTFDQILELDSNPFYASSPSLYNPAVSSPSSTSSSTSSSSSPIYPAQQPQQECIPDFTSQQSCLGTAPMILEDDLWEHHYRLQQEQQEQQACQPQQGAPSKHLFYGLEPQLYSPMSNGFLANYSTQYSEDEVSSSCGSSPYMDQSFLTADMSPITPSGSPFPYNYNNIALNSDFQCTINGNGFPTMLSPEFSSDSYLALLTQQQQQQTSPFSSPATVPSLYASPLHTLDGCEEVEQEESNEVEEEEEEEEEDDGPVLPNRGNMELRGMGLYDETPSLYPSSPSYPPESLYEATRGKGLVLERSFGLPEQMKLNDDHGEGEGECGDEEDGNEQHQQWSSEFQPKFFY